MDWQQGSKGATSRHYKSRASKGREGKTWGMGINEAAQGKRGELLASDQAKMRAGACANKRWAHGRRLLARELMC